MTSLMVAWFMVSSLGTHAVGSPPFEPPLTLVNVSSHCDWSWGHTRAWHEERYAEIIRQVLLIMLATIPITSGNWRTKTRNFGPFWSGRHASGRR